MKLRLPDEVPTEKGLKLKAVENDEDYWQTPRRSSNRKRIETKVWASLAHFPSNLPDEVPTEKGLKQTLPTPVLTQ